MRISATTTSAGRRREWTRGQVPAARGPQAVPPSPAALVTAVWAKRILALVVLGWASAAVAGFQAALMFVNLLGFAAAFVGLRWAGIGLIGVGMLCALEPITGPLLATGGLWRWNNFNYWLLVVLVIFLPVITRLNDLHTRCLQALVLLLTAGLFLSPDVLTGVQYVFAMVTAFGVLVYCIRARSDVDAWYWLGIVSGVLAAVGCFVYLVRMEALPPVNRNVWCLFPLTALFAICLGFTAARSTTEQVALGALAVINFSWVFLSTSRGGLIPAAVCMLYLLAQVPGRLRRLQFAAAAAIVSVIVLSQFSSLQETAIDRLDELFDSSKTYSERTSNRSQLALAGWRVFLDHPLGAGTASFSAEQARLGLFGWSRSGEFSAHSGWIRVLAENGVPGMLVLLAYVGSFALVGWKQRRYGALKIGVLTTAVFTLLLVSYEFEFKGIWLLAAGATVALRASAHAGRAAAAKIGIRLVRNARSA